MNSQNDGLHKKRILISSLMAIFSFGVNVLIGFWSSPFIVSKLGSEAYGFSSLGGNFTTYMSLVTVAINAFAARYITISVQKKDYELASKYFTSVFFANLGIMGIMIIPIGIIVYKLERIFSIANNLIFDVKIQWSILFLAWILDLFFKVFSTATFVKDRLDINHGLSAVSNLIRLAVILISFSFFRPKLWYVGIASLSCSVFVDVGYLIAKKKLMPEVKIQKKCFDWKCLKTLFLKGVWNSINQLASLLMNGFDLVITNLAVDSEAMGFYSIAQTIPTYLQSLMYTLCDLFNPNLTVSYATGNNNQVRDGLKFSMKFNSLLLMVPLLGFFVYGIDFYKIWQYSLNEEAIHTIFILSSLVILPMISSVLVQPLLTVNTITARLKVPVFVNILIGVSNIIVELILVFNTDLGVYAIAGVSSVLLLIRNYAFYPIYSAKTISMPGRTFYPIIIRGTGCGIIVFVFLYFTHSLLSISGWGEMIFYAFIFGSLAEIIVFSIMLDRDDRKKVKNVLKNKLIKRKTRN